MSFQHFSWKQVYMSDVKDLQDISFEEESDAQILWDDVCDLLEDEGLSSPTLAMFRNCKGIEINDKEDGSSELVIAIGSGFIQRNIQNNLKLIKTALERAAFQPMDLTSRLIKRHEVVQQNQTTISQEDLSLLNQATTLPSQKEVSSFTYHQPIKQRPFNPLVEEITEADVNLTFDTFVEGEENQLALQASKAVANGSRAYNPLFIYGNSGLGKTHLLKAIQNYLYKNEPGRVCVYRQARDFVRDYTNAMQADKDVKDALEQNYKNVDVLIIDDIQGFKGAAKTVDFFFDTFNYLMSNNKQIILAADETPLELGFDERVTSRIGMGVPIPIQAPNYELKLALIQSFYKRMKEDALKDGTSGFSGVISDEYLEYMAKKAGTNIRTIKSYCQACILNATRKQDIGEYFSQEDINKVAISYWGLNQRNFNINQVQRFVEQRYGITHSDLVSNKRTKNLMEPRHVGVWLAREFTDLTLQQIGEKFGGRTHATVKHSIWWVEDCQKKDKVFYDRTLKMKEDLQSQAE